MNIYPSKDAAKDGMRADRTSSRCNVGIRLNLSKRMKAVAALVPPSSCVWDVGCDHGYVSIHLVSSGICKEAIASDVRPGPLARAIDNISNYNLEDKIHTVISDGLKASVEGLTVSIPQTVIIAGMGGELMVRIMRESPERVADTEYFVLQPQTDVGGVRSFIAESGFVIEDEDLVCEDGKYYPMFRIKNTRFSREILNRYSDEINKTVPKEALIKYGGILIEGRHPLLRDFLLWEERVDSAIETGIREENRDIEPGGKLDLRLRELSKARDIRNSVLTYLDRKGVRK